MATTGWRATIRQRKTRPSGRGPISGLESENTVARHRFSWEQNFTFDVTVAVATGPGLAEADDVVVSDTLPAGMLLDRKSDDRLPRWRVYRRGWGYLLHL